MERNELDGLHIDEIGLDVHHILNDFDMDAELGNIPTDEEMEAMAEAYGQQD